MSHQGNSGKPTLIRFLFENSLFLIGGAALALVWANVDMSSYQRVVHFDLTSLVGAGDTHSEGDSATTHAEGEDGEEPHLEGDNDSAQHTVDEKPDGAAAESEGGETEEGEERHVAESGGHHGLTVHFLINDILMALFFAIAGKEVWESMLPGGALSNPRKAATPLLATLGGIIGPAGLYILGAILVGQSGWFGQEGNLGRGWAVPCATDIAFSYLVARIVFGNGHPAIAFLLLLAIADDAAGLIILAVAYPQGDIQVYWFGLTIAAIVVGFLFRRLRLHSFWWYLLIPGTMSWISFYYAGIHAALGLVPIIPCLPHAHTDLGIFARGTQSPRHVERV